MLTFRIRKPVRPAELGISPDTRALGLHLCSLTLKKALELDRLPKVGDTLNLADNEIDAAKFLSLNPDAWRLGYFNAADAPEYLLMRSNEARFQRISEAVLVSAQ